MQPRGAVRAAALALTLALGGCAAGPDQGRAAPEAAPATERADPVPEPVDPRLVVQRADPPSRGERYCAWFGDRDGDLLYFGQAAFWTAFRAHGHDPRGDLRARGPQRIGRLDLARERLLAPLDVTLPEARSGVWDVLAHPNGRVYFTTFFETSGWVDPRTGAHARLEAVGPGLSELALASGGQIVAARYGHPARRDGGVVRFSPDGFVISDWTLAPPAGRRVAPKSVAYDAGREETWVLSDLLPVEGDGAVAYDARVLDRWGRERLRIERPEIQFATFGPDGTGYLAEVDGASLSLRILAPGEGRDPRRLGRVVPLDAGFPAGFDFVQDLKVAPDGRVVATRWSGFVHVVAPDGRATTVRMPRLDDEGLYYTGVLRGDRLCATYCSDVAVACRSVGPPP